METILVTGVNGFVGHHLAHELHAAGHRVIGTGMDAELDPLLRTTVDHYYPHCDLTDPEAVSKLPLTDLDAVVNLAGLAQVGSSFDQAEKYLNINVAVHTVLAKQLLAIKSHARVVAVSTGAVYDSDQAMPLNENSRLIKAGSPYALSKIAMEEALGPLQAQGVDVVIARPFNHVGPGQLPGFLVPDLAAQVLHQDTITVGNLQTERDYTDVRDVVKAYRLLATQPKLEHRLYNICSGKKVSGQEILRLILAAANKPNAKVVVDQSRIRPSDPPSIVGSSQRVQTDTDWAPSIPIEETIKDFVVSLQ